MAAVNFWLPEKSFVNEIKLLQLKDKNNVNQCTKFKGYASI